MTNDRAPFEKWLRSEQDIDPGKWDVARNCYVSLDIHIAWKAYQRGKETAAQSPPKQKRECSELAQSGTVAATPTSADATPETDDAYFERNNLVAALARLFPSGIRKTDIPGWSSDWHGCCLIDLPSGQISYHYHDTHAHLFAGLPAYTNPWDGHDKDTVHQRLAALRAATDSSDFEDMDRQVVIGLETNGQPNVGAVIMRLLRERNALRKQVDYDTECIQRLQNVGAELESVEAELANKIEELSCNEAAYKEILGEKSYCEIAEELATLRADAQRYRWLRCDKGTTVRLGVTLIVNIEDGDWIYGPELDELIDAAIAEANP